MSNMSFDFSSFLSDFMGGNGYDYDKVFSGNTFGSSYQNFFSSGSFGGSGSFGSNDTLSNLFGGGDDGIQSMFMNKLFGPDPINSAKLEQKKADLEELDADIADKEAEIAEIKEDIEYLEDQQLAAQTRAGHKDGFFEGIDKFLNGDEDEEDAAVAAALLAKAETRLSEAEKELSGDSGDGGLVGERETLVTEIDTLNTAIIEQQDERFSNLFNAWSTSEDGDISDTILDIVDGGNGDIDPISVPDPDPDPATGGNGNGNTVV